MHTLNTRGKMEISEVVELLGVSESTSRRMLIRLEAKGEIVRTIGGVMLAPDNPLAYSFEKLNRRNIEEKVRIGALAAGLIEPGDIVYFDSGTTTAQICAALVKRMDDVLRGSLTVFTNSLVNLNILAPVCAVHLVGGKYRSERQDFCDFLAEEAIKLVNFTKCFVGADGFVYPSGFTTNDFVTASLDQLVLQRSKRKIVAADSTKYRRVSLVTHAKLDEIDCVVTDGNIPDEIKAALLARDIDVLIC